MDGRITAAPQPAGRFAALFRSIVIQRVRPIPPTPDYGDIEEWVDPFLEKELLFADIEEAKEENNLERVQELEAQLVIVKTILNSKKLGSSSDAQTPAGRLADFFRAFVLPPGYGPNFDKGVEQLLNPFIEKERLLSKLKEADRAQNEVRHKYLASALVKVEAKIAESLKHDL